LRLLQTILYDAQHQLLQLHHVNHNLQYTHKMSGPEESAARGSYTKNTLHTPYASSARVDRHKTTAGAEVLLIPSILKPGTSIPGVKPVHPAACEPLAKLRSAGTGRACTTLPLHWRESPSAFAPLP
jgi:hypothetical protein